MKKNEIINEIMKQVKSVTGAIYRIYGVPFGIGYDYEIEIEFDKSNLIMRGHAVPKSWTCFGWLRPDQLEGNTYKGRGNDYFEEVMEFINTKECTRGILHRLPKPLLEKQLENLKNENPDILM
jgi:hypothetical protein